MKPLSDPTEGPRVGQLQDCVFLYMDVCVHTQALACIDLYRHIYIYICTYIHIYIHTKKFLAVNLKMLSFIGAEADGDGSQMA